MIVTVGQPTVITYIVDTGDAATVFPRLFIYRIEASVVVEGPTQDMVHVGHGVFVAQYTPVAGDAAYAIVPYDDATYVLEHPTSAKVTDWIRVVLDPVVEGSGLDPTVR